MNRKEKEELIDCVLKSNTFKNAPTSIALLQFLAKATFEEVDLKETTIGLEFFGLKDPGTRVRVNVFNLRKKITKYYEEEGCNDVKRIKIIKGQYAVSFYRLPNVKLQTRYSIFKKLTLAHYLIALFVFVGCILFWPQKNPVLWNSFFTNGKETNLVVGDVFGMIGKTVTGNTGWTRDYSINNLKDFYAFLEENPKLKDSIHPPPYVYVNQMAVTGAVSLSNFFAKYDKKLGIRFTSKTSIDEIKENNTIYIGPVKNKNVFINLFNQSNPYFTLKDSVLTFRNHPHLNDTVYKFPYRVYKKELAIVAKLHGYNNSEQLLFFSNHDIGINACVKLFTDTNALKKMSDNSSYFVAVYEVEGEQRTDISIKKISKIAFD